jgi:hypothetical protein
MILEGLVTTLNVDGSPHLAPMGPRVETDWTHFVLRPFPTSHTYQNLVRHRQGVFHITDDVLLLAKAAIGKVIPFPATEPAQQIEGVVLSDTCRFLEFRVLSVDDRGERVTLVAEVVHSGRKRDFFGFNRAKHAIVEAAILATRLHILALNDVATEFRKLRIIVEKTGGHAELLAMEMLEGKLREAEARR